MSESENVATTSPASPTVASSSRHEVKEAEVKLKEMSRKAKERKTTQVSRKPPQRQGSQNLRLVLIGGFGVGVLGILYLMLRPKEYVFTPNEDKEKPVSPVKEKPPKPETGFEINSF